MGSVRGDGGCCKWIERSLLMSIVSCPLLMSILLVGCVVYAQRIIHVFNIGIII